MHIEKSIHEYILQQTQGTVRLSFKQSRHIVNLVTTAKMAYCKLYRYNASFMSWQLIRITDTTDTIINKTIIEALAKKPAENFYRWECYNSVGEFQGNIFTINSNLF